MRKRGITSSNQRLNTCGALLNDKSIQQFFFRTQKLSICEPALCRNIQHAKFCSNPKPVIIITKQYTDADY